MIDTPVKLPDICADVGGIELVIEEAFKDNNPDVIQIDMSEVEYLTTSSMIHLIAFTDRLLTQGIEVIYHLPLNIDVRNIMRLWRFPIVMKEITGRSFASLVRSSDLQYFGESNLSGDYFDKFTANDEGLAELMKKDYFSIFSIPYIENDQKSSAIAKQHELWTVIQEILKRHLKNYENKKRNVIPNRIIYECMTNAFRHSGAVKLITGSFFDRPGKMLTISYWDNGRSIIDTLHEALANEKVNKQYESSSDNDDFVFSLLVKTQVENEPLEGYFHLDRKITQYSSSGEILLHSFSPGVTRDPEGQLPFSGNPYTAEYRTGMGLPTLLNASIDMLGGSVAVRAGHYFVNFKESTLTQRKMFYKLGDEFMGKSLYRAKVTRYDEMPEFEGNMVTIRLPLK